MIRNLAKIAALAALLVTTACTNSGSRDAISPVTKPTVSSVENQAIASPGAAALKMGAMKRERLARAENSGRKNATLKEKNAAGTSEAAFASVASPIISSRVTFDKSAIFNRVFLYGTDLQYSSVGQADGMMLQSMAMGHVTARFQVLGDRLQLMAEEKYKFESNINIPLRLIHEWPILSQDVDHMTVEIATASPTLATLFGAQNPARTSWVRSVEFVPQGSYLLIESSIELGDGKIAEFMESLFPRETLADATTKPFFDDPSLEPMAARFGFLSNPAWLDLPEGRQHTAVASRFTTPPAGKTIDWYVTPNIPAEFIPAVQSGIEGWNRYSQKMFARDFIRFAGILPAGIKLGDPRYNVVNWDSVVDASAAYESQASDPETGVQSHSMIYLPYAWVKIGREFWEKGQLTQDRTDQLKAAIDKVQFLGRKVDVRCFNEATLGAINPRMKEDPDAFSKALLRGTLFHEIGHALGLAHNFKGSLAWNPDDASSPVTSSIMDYNQYQIEGGVFNAPVGAAGALLEYDRQIISVLYNDGKDIAKTDAEVSHCDDTAADSQVGGVDPFCIRYDAGADPTTQLVRTMQLIQDPNATLGKTKSLAVSAEKTVAALGEAALITSDLEVSVVEAAFRTQMLALIQYYVSAGAQGLNYMMSANLRNLWTFKNGTTPAGIDPVALRARVATTMDELMSMESFSAATHTAFEKVGDQATTWLKTTAWYGNAAQAARTDQEVKFRALAVGALGAVEKAILPRVRTRQIQGLARTATSPFFLTTSVDYEAKALGWLEAVLVRDLPSGTAYTVGERVAAAQTLATFAGIPQATSIKTAAYSKVETEIARAVTAEQRESLRALLILLK